MATNAFVLKSVELQNWKTFADATLEVESEGLTGIVGRNGSGKSSFVEAILWCLYGSRPEGVVKGDLRRRGIDPAKDVTSVKVTFLHAGQTVEVFRQMKGKNHTVTGAVFLNGDDVTRVTGSTVEAWILNRLGMDSAGFTTAVVVPQKELDAIVDMKPMDRRKSIERLAGIEEMNLAVQSARAQENDISKEVKVMPGSEEDVERATEAVEQVKVELNRATMELESTQNHAQEAKSALDETLSKTDTMQKQLDEAGKVHQKITNLQAQQNLSQQSITSLNERVSELRAEVGDIDTSQHAALQEQYRSVNAEISALQTEFSQQKNDAARLATEHARLSEERDSLAADLSDAQQKFDSLSSAVAGIPSAEELGDRVTALNAEIDSLASERGRLSSRIADMEESAQALSGASHCPTCKSDLDDPSQLVQKFNQMAQDFKAELEQNKVRTQTAQNEITQAREHERALTQNRFALESSAKSLTRIQASLDSVESLLGQNEMKRKALPVLDEQHHAHVVSALEDKKQEILQQGLAISNALKAQGKLASLEQELNAAVDSGKHLAPEIAALESALEKYGDLSSLEMYVESQKGKIEQLREQHQQIFSTMKDLQSSVTVLTERLAHAESTLSNEKQKAQAKAQAVEALQKHAAVTDLLDEYRKERIARIAPELSTTATDMISQMTNGRFIEVKVADDFATSVVQNDGIEYGVAELSGGEKSIVALALRIAIGSLITGDSAGLLWLDEVLPAQDAERREAVLSVIRDLPIQQVVMINHTHEAEDVVDRVVRVHYSPEGSTVSSEATLEEQVDEAA